MTEHAEHLAAFIEGLAAPAGAVLNAGVILQREGEVLVQHAAGALHPDGDARFTLDTPLRFASVSKAVTARLVIALSLQGQLDLDRPLADTLALDCPACVTPRALLRHTSGVTDTAGYLIDPPDTITAFLVRHRGSVYAAPGRFRYSNLGYILLGALAEKATGDRFDRAVTAHVLAPLGVNGRFAWLGMAPAARAAAGPIVRPEGHGFAIQIDADVPHEGLHDRHGRPFDLSAYSLSEHTGLFAPHAGLRMSLRDAQNLAAAFCDDSAQTIAQITPIWRHDPQTDNGDACDGLFSAYGAGVQIHPPSDWYSRPLVGHFGNAYGAACGAWADRERKASFAYMLNGMAPARSAGDREAFYSKLERELFKAIDRALG